MFTCCTIAHEETDYAYFEWDKQKWIEDKEEFLEKYEKEILLKEM